MNLYDEMKASHQKKVSAYLNKYAFFAFNDEQFKEGLEKLGTEPKELSRIPGGGYIISSKAKGLVELINSTQQERETALRDPDTGKQFAFDMFYSELANHEYSYTGNAAEALEALGMDYERLRADPMLQEAFEDAKAAALAG